MVTKEKQTPRRTVSRQYIGAYPNNITAQLARPQCVLIKRRIIPTLFTAGVQQSKAERKRGGYYNMEIKKKERNVHTRRRTANI